MKRWWSGESKGKGNLERKVDADLELKTNAEGVADLETKTNVEGVGGDLRAVVRPIDLNEDKKMKRTKGNITSIQNSLARFL